MPCVRSSAKGHGKHSDGLGKYWQRGVKAPAIWVPKSLPALPVRDLRADGDLTEGEWQAFGRFGY